MKIVVDMNLSPLWVDALRQGGHEANHWSQVGDPRATDDEIMAWARTHGCIVMTHDLDFTTALALTRAAGPSLIQMRTHDTLPDAMGSMVLSVLSAHEDALAKGAVVTIDRSAARVRILPLT
jgi:predicted nuclease of predicted toxin-antitoxin system